MDTGNNIIILTTIICKRCVLFEWIDPMNAILYPNPQKENAFQKYYISPKHTIIKILLQKIQY